jgi:hypothetical protein
MTSGIQYEVRMVGSSPDRSSVTKYGDYTMAASKARELRTIYPETEVHLFRRIVPAWEEVSVE